MKDEEALRVPRGFRASGVKAGIKPSGGLDVAVLAAEGPCAAAGTFTTNRIRAAPVKWCDGLLPADDVRAVVVNSGNANAATGAEGLANAERTARRAAAFLGCETRQVLVASTGVIGHQLPMDRLEAGIEQAVGSLSAAPEAFHAASQAILTTDTRPKVASLQRSIAGREVRLLGLAKGAAMIGPRMATMLAFLMTDAPLSGAALAGALAPVVDATFNCVSVEGHASTNDTVLLLSSAGVSEPPLAGADLAQLVEMVQSACESLAQQIANDGEGSTHFITIHVEGCRDTHDARAIARTVADSPLVKTAIHGADPNWGRIVSAAGHAGVAFEETELSLWINDVLVYHEGSPVPFDADQLSRSIRAERAVGLRLSLQSGPASTQFWTCDLTAEYVRLNADYTT